MKFLNHLQLNYNELQNATLHKATTAGAPGSPVAGTIFYNTSLNLPKWYDGSEWRDFGSVTQFDVDTTIASGDHLVFSDESVTGSPQEDPNNKITVDNFIAAAPALLTEAAIADGDYILFLDGGATGTAKKESLEDLVGVIAGTVTTTGLSDANSVLKLDIQSMTPSTTIDDADLVVVDDGANGTLRKMTRANFIESAALDSINIDGGAIDGVTLGTNSAITQAVIDNVDINGKVITMTGSTDDTAVFTAGTDGTLSIVTTDTAAAAANIQITADGTAELAGTTVTLDSSGGITLDADGGTVTFADGGVSLGTITSSGYSGVSATATTLANGREINGVSFNGSQNITITAAGSTLSDTVTVAKGGTGATSFADKSVIITQDTGTDTLAAVAMTTSGQLLIGGSSGPAVATLTQGSNMTITNADGAITIAGTANDNVSVANLKAALAGGFGSNAVTIGDSDDVVTIGNDLTVTGDLIVSGDVTTVNTATITVEDPLIKLASGNNAADTVDIGLFGLYDTSGSQDLYGGLFRDANDSGKWKLFKDSQTDPGTGTTIDTSATGYAVASLVANLEGTVTTTGIIMDGDNITGIDNAGNFTDDDVHIMTSAAINDRYALIDSDTTGTATTATNVAVTHGDITDESCFIPFVTAGATANYGLKTEAGLAYDATNNKVTATTFAGALEGQADTVATITGLAPDIATTQATQGNITSAANLATVGTISSGTWQSTDIGIEYGGTGASTASAAFTALKQDADTTTTGVVELATDDEVLTGVGDGKVVDATQIAEQRMCVATINTADTNWRSNLQAEITHGFGTYDVMVEVYDMTSDTQETVLCNVKRAEADGTDDNNKVLIEVSEEHAAGTLRVLITSLRGAATGTVSYATS